MSRIEPFGHKLTTPDDLGHHPDDLDIVRINMVEGPDADGCSRAASSPDSPEASPDDPDKPRMIRMPDRTIRLQHMASVKNGHGYPDDPEEDPDDPGNSPDDPEERPDDPASATPFCDGKHLLSG